MNKNKIKILGTGAVLIVVIGLIVAYRFGIFSKHDSKDRVYVEKVSTIIQKDNSGMNRYSGVVQPQKTVNINADSERTIIETYVKVGDEVSEGDPLFAYDTEELKLEYEQAKLEVEGVNSDISSYKTQIADLEREKKTAPATEQFEYTTQIQTIQNSIKQSEYEKSSKELDLEKIQDKINKSQVLSTANGVIKSINDSNSQSMGDGSSDAYISILVSGTYRIKASADELNIGNISVGQRVIVRSRVDENVTWEGKIDKIDTGDMSSANSDDMYMDSEMDSGSNSATKYPFYIALRNADGLLLGQHVLIEPDFGQGEQREGIWLSRNYLVFENPENESINDTEYFDGEGWEDLEEYDSEMEDSDVSEYDGAGAVGKVMSNVRDAFIDTVHAEEADVLMNEWAEENEDADGTQGVLSIPDVDDEEEEESEEDDTEWDDEDWDEEEEEKELSEYDGAMGKAYVWADDGNHVLKKVYVELGLYDPDLDEYEIVSGLTEDDYIAWPMDGLYEGVTTVMSVEEVDYTSDLYSGTESGYSTEENWEEGDWEEGDWEEGTEGWIDDSVSEDDVYVEDGVDAEVSE